MSETDQVITMTANDIQLSPSAANKMAQLLAGADDDIHCVRIFVSGGGCGGMSYGMTFAEEVTSYDSSLRGEGYKLVVDAVALNYLRGCEIDFERDSFIFKNVFQAVGGSGACGGCGGSGF